MIQMQVNDLMALTQHSAQKIGEFGSVIKPLRLGDICQILQTLQRARPRQHANVGT